MEVGQGEELSLRLSGTHIAFHFDTFKLSIQFFFLVFYVFVIGFFGALLQRVRSRYLHIVLSVIVTVT